MKTLSLCLLIPSIALSNPVILQDELIPYALNTNVVHASYSEDYGYTIDDSSLVNGNLVVGNGDDGQFSFTLDEGSLSYIGVESNTVTYRCPYIIGTSDGSFISGKDVENTEYSINVPSNSNGKYLVLTSNSNGVLDIDLSDYALNTNVVHANYDPNGGRYTLESGKVLEITVNDRYLILNNSELVFGDKNNEYFIMRPIPGNTFLTGLDNEYNLPTNSGYFALTKNPDGSVLSSGWVNGISTNVEFMSSAGLGAIRNSLVVPYNNDQDSDLNSLVVNTTEVSPIKLMLKSGDEISIVTNGVSFSKDNIRVDNNGYVYTSNNVSDTVEITLNSDPLKKYVFNEYPFNMNQEVLIPNYSQNESSFRKTYSDYIYSLFANLDYDSGHIYPLSELGPGSNPRSTPESINRIPDELQLYSDYSSYLNTSSSTWNGSTNYTFFTEGRTDPIDVAYSNSLISVAWGPTKLNSDFVDQGLLNKLRCVAAERSDYTAEKSAIKVSKHYLIAANHYKQNTHRFFLSDGTYTDVSVNANYNIPDTDLCIQYVATGLPDDIPNMEFISSTELGKLSKSYLVYAPALRITKANTLSLCYLADVTNDEYSAAYYAGYSGSWNFMNDTYPQLNTNNKYLYSRNFNVKLGLTQYKVSDIISITEVNPADNHYVFLGSDNASNGDSGHPVFSYYNDHIWIYFIVHSASFIAVNSDNLLYDSSVCQQLDQYIRSDSVSKGLDEEFLTEVKAVDILGE